MKQFGKWLLVGVVTIIALKYTYGLLYNVFQPFSDFLITHLSFPDWLANFLLGLLCRSFEKYRSLNPH